MDLGCLQIIRQPGLVRLLDYGPLAGNVFGSDRAEPMTVVFAIEAVVSRKLRPGHRQIVDRLQLRRSALLTSMSHHRVSAAECYRFFPMLLPRYRTSDQVPATPSLHRPCAALIRCALAILNGVPACGLKPYYSWSDRGALRL